MKKLPLISLILFIVLTFSNGCENIQQNLEDKARQVQETANKEVGEHLPKIDSSLNQLDTAFHQTLNKQLERADTLINHIQETELKK